MPPTERLYYADAYLTAFEAVVVAHGEVAGRPAVAVDRSAFYPEGGGQPADQGTLGSCRILDVQVAGETVWHVLAEPDEGAALPVGATIQGAVDWARRFDHMQQHCGQHLLTAACIATGGLQTVAFHLGDTSVTIDLDTPDLTPEQVRAAEDLVNRVIWENRPVLARFVAPEELAGIQLRKPPTVSGPVRVVSVPGYDHSACGGTHPSSTGAVGMVAVQGWSRQRGGTRVEFACGGRALRELRRLGAAAHGASAVLSVGVDELPGAAERALASQRALAKELAQAQATLDGFEAERLYATGLVIGPVRIVRTALSGLSAERLRMLAQGIAARPGGVAILGSAGERVQLCVACGPESGRDARTILQAGLAVLGGRGGGSTQLAQGGGGSVELLEAALDAMAAIGSSFASGT